MIQLYQSLFYVGFNNSEQKPAIFLGKTANKNYIVAVQNKDGSIKEEICYSLAYITPCREEDTSSPTGMRIYYGGLAKKVYNTLKGKMPDEALLKKEFAKIKTKQV